MLLILVLVESQEQYKDNIKWIKSAQEHGLVRLILYMFFEIFNFPYSRKFLQAFIHPIL